MPCYDDGKSTPYIDNLKVKTLEKQVKKLEAMLCAVLSSTPNNTIGNIDEKESGITKEELRKWWSKHQEEDNKRRQKEKAKRVHEQLKKNALNKLSRIERKALGLEL